MFDNYPSFTPIAIFQKRVENFNYKIHYFKVIFATKNIVFILFQVSN